MSIPRPKTQIYLASRSPRRRELLKQIGIAFEVLVLRENPSRGTDVDESHRPGESPGDYVRRIRIERAARLLRSTSIPLAQVAQAAGFVDQSHMTRVFARQFGFTPGAWRRAARLQ